MRNTDHDVGGLHDSNRYLCPLPSGADNFEVFVFIVEVQIGPNTGLGLGANVIVDITQGVDDRGENVGCTSLPGVARSIGGPSTNPLGANVRSG